MFIKSNGRYQIQNKSSDIVIIAVENMHEELHKIAFILFSWDIERIELIMIKCGKINLLLLRSLKH